MKINLPSWDYHKVILILAVLGRSEEDGVFIDELDMLQTETETLLAAAAKRMRHLEAEINILTTWQEKGKDNKKTMTLGKGVC